MADSPQRRRVSPSGTVPSTVVRGVCACRGGPSGLAEGNPEGATLTDATPTRSAWRVREGSLRGTACSSAAFRRASPGTGSRRCARFDAPIVGRSARQPSPSRPSARGNRRPAPPMDSCSSSRGALFPARPRVSQRRRSRTQLSMSPPSASTEIISCEAASTPASGFMLSAPSRGVRPSRAGGPFWPGNSSGRAASTARTAKRRRPVKTCLEPLTSSA